MKEAAIETSLQRLADESAIRGVISRYARAVDRLDWDLLRSCYHPDAIEDRGRYSGPVAGFVAWLEEVLAAFESTWHLVGNPLVELDGDVAWAETYCLGIQQVARNADTGPETRVVPCRYCDRFERRAGEWRIARRTTVYEPAVVVPLDRVSPPLGAPSHRDRTDVSYRRDTLAQ